MPQDEFSQLVIAHLTAPDEALLEKIIITHLTPIATRFARKVSLSREDREDAEMEILAHIQEAAKPPEMRRLNERTGKPVAGYHPSMGSAGAFFSRAAKRKSQDIVKSRCRKWRREGVIMAGILDYGELVTVPLEAED